MILAHRRQTGRNPAAVRAAEMIVERGEVMAMPQRDDTIEAIKRRAAEKNSAEEKKKAEARARAAYRWKQRQGARCGSKRCPPTSRNRRGRNGRKSCARSNAANRGFVRCADECGIILEKEVVNHV